MHWPCQAAPILCSPEGAQHLVEEACRPQAAQRAVPSRDSADGGPRGIRGLEEDQVNQHGWMRGLPETELHFEKEIGVSRKWRQEEGDKKARRGLGTAVQAEETVCSKARRQELACHGGGPLEMSRVKNVKDCCARWGVWAWSWRLWDRLWRTLSRKMTSPDVCLGAILVLVWRMNWGQAQRSISSPCISVGWVVLEPKQ